LHVVGLAADGKSGFAVDGFDDALPDGRVVFNNKHSHLHGVLRRFPCR
jgi:hypothetical protein